MERGDRCDACSPETTSGKTVSVQIYSSPNVQMENWDAFPFALFKSPLDKRWESTAVYGKSEGIPTLVSATCNTRKMYGVRLTNNLTGTKSSWFL